MARGSPTRGHGKGNGQPRLFSDTLRWIYRSVEGNRRDGLLPFLLYVARGNKCFVGMVFLTYRRQPLGGALKILLRVTEQLERSPSVKLKILLKESQAIRRIFIWYCNFGLLDEVSVVLDVILEPDPWFSHQLQRLYPGLPAAFYLPLKCFNATVIIMGISALFSTIFLSVVVYRSTGAILCALGHEFSECVDMKDARRLARLQSEVINACHLSNRKMTEGIHLSFLTSMFLMSLWSAANIIRDPETVDSLSLAAMSSVWFFLLPLCYAGQDQEDGWQCLREEVYAGPWLHEVPTVRRMRQMVVLGTRACPSVLLFGSRALNRHACGAALSAWFKYVNALLNITGR
ncbi:uncharacterized protein LOC127750011 isoform X2 [Frankliniella occidentalis]|uniref:Uncharacterized protein LOC127750011 isoform X2 n=1 Tax=Frankliniella occidentalis TaxID=133901 RepID=A0A9C6UA24_FRAOC|nr:uncharacterized protein LOC127750011 isoform X2 [Frankliniella occidentalis]